MENKLTKSNNFDFKIVYIKNLLTKTGLTKLLIDYLINRGSYFVSGTLNFQSFTQLINFLIADKNFRNFYARKLVFYFVKHEALF